jgi:hypothetical protein
MKRTLTIVVLLLVTVSVLSAQETLDVKGAWTLTLETPQGSIPLNLSFAKIEGENISGTLSSPQGDIAVAGTLKGSEISFAGTFEGNGRSLTLTFTGKTTKDGMSGTADFGGMGTGNWSAKRPG